MSGTDVGVAFVRVLPDTREFRAQLQSQVNAAVAAVRIPGVGTAGAAGSGGAAAAATTQMSALAAATTVASGASAKEAAAALAVARALEAQRIAEEALTAAIGRNAAAAQIQAAQSKVTIASAATNVAQLRQAELLASTSGAGVKAASGLAAASTQAKILQGSIIGLTRITPVAVFGLTAYGSAAIGLGLAIKSAISATADFESQLNSFQAVTGVSAEQLDQVRKQAIALGADTNLAAISAGDAAQALTELAKAGLSVNDAIGASRGVLELAGAASISAGDAAKIVATQLNAFKLAGTDAVKVADLLASASIAAQGEITDFAAAFQQVSSVANQTGLTVEQTTALLVELAKSGLQGADAGTSLRTTLLRLIPTTKEASKFAAALGIQLDKSKTLGEQLPQVIEQYRNALSALNPIQRTTVLNQILGQDAIRAGSIIFDQNTGALDRNVRALSEAGSAAALNEAHAKGLSGAVAGLQSNLETVGIRLGSLVDGPLEAFVRGLSDAITETEELAGVLGKFVTSIGNIEIPVIEVPIKVVVSTGLGEVAGFAKDNAKFLAAGGGPVIATAAIIKEILDQFKDPKTFGSPELNLGEDNTQFGIGNFVANLEDERQKEFDRTFGAAARRNKDFRNKLQKAVQKAISDGLPGADTLKPGEAVVNAGQSQRFQSPILAAQLKGDLQAELRADKALESFLQERLNRAKAGSAAFFVIQKALVAAHDNTLSVERQITANQEAFNKEQEQIAKEATEEAKRNAAAQEQLRQTIVDIQTQRLSNRLSLAQLTPGTGDDKRIFKLQIDFLEVQRKQAQKIADTAAKGSQAQADARKKVETLNGQIIAIRTQIKNLGKDGSGDAFTIQDLFAKAADQFNTFGSNIAGRAGVLSGQDERAALAQTIDPSLGVAGAQLSEAEKQTAILASIDSKLGPFGRQSTDRTTGVPDSGNGRRGNLAAIRRAQGAAFFSFSD